MLVFMLRIYPEFLGHHSVGVIVSISRSKTLQRLSENVSKASRNGFSIPVPLAISLKVKVDNTLRNKLQVLI